MIVVIVAKDANEASSMAVTKEKDKARLDIMTKKITRLGMWS